MAANEQTTPRPAPPAPQPSRVVAEPATVERCTEDRAANPTVSANIGKRP
jgi:hypothetical protein